MDANALKRAAAARRSGGLIKSARKQFPQTGRIRHCDQSGGETIEILTTKGGGLLAGDGFVLDAIGAMETR